LNNNFENKEKKPIVSMIWTVLLALLLAVVSVVCYSPIKNHFYSEQNAISSYVKSNQFIYKLAHLTHYLARYDLENKNSEYSDYQDSKSLKYYLINKETHKTISNLEDLSSNNLNHLTKTSLFYLKVTFDENGNMNTTESPNKNFNGGAFRDALNGYSSNRLPKNSQVIYMIPKNLPPTDDVIMGDIGSYLIGFCMTLILIIGAIGTLLLCILAFSIPYSYQKRVSLCLLFNKIFLEFKAFIWIGLGLAGFLALSIITTYYTSNKLIDMIYHTDPLFYAISIPIVFILYLLIYLNIVYIKSIYYTGFKEGFIKNSLMGKFICYVAKRIKKILLTLLSIDLRKDYTRKLLLLLGGNLFALIIIGASWPFGFILAIAYSIALFSLLLKMLNKIKMLNESTSKLATGVFDGVLDEDMGLLTPIAENLNHIKDGFKVAVDKEIKSQNMKTELISSVSHDLKTPLTCIITYVDLLKDETLDAEKQKEYIAVLDKKSKRLQTLIEDLFEVSKATSGNIELHLETIDIISLLKQTLGELQEKIAASDLQIKTKFPDHKIVCSLDGQRSYRVFENLIGNILKYSLPHSRVYIDIEEDAAYVRITFKNISAYEMNFDVSEITERFTRGDKARHTEGSGLGLAIAKGLTELQNGTLTIYVDGDLFKVVLSFKKTNLEL